MLHTRDVSPGHCERTRSTEVNVGADSLPRVHRDLKLCFLLDGGLLVAEVGLLAQGNLVLTLRLPLSEGLASLLSSFVFKSQFLLLKIVHPLHNLSLFLLCLLNQNLFLSVVIVIVACVGLLRSEVAEGGC